MGSFFCLFLVFISINFFFQMSAFVAFVSSINSGLEAGQIIQRHYRAINQRKHGLNGDYKSCLCALTHFRSLKLFWTV